MAGSINPTLSVAAVALIVIGLLVLHGRTLKTELTMLQGELVEVNDAQAIYRTPQHDYTRKLWASIPRLTGKTIAEGTA